jgi:RNA polymerase sigma-70 factor, ECF subfamily
MTDLDEQTLVEQAQSDPRAFAALYDRYIGRIYTYAYRQTADETLAQDVTSATFEKALRHIRRYRWQGTGFCAWLYRIARNEIAQHHRRQRFLRPLFEWWATERRATETAVQTRERHHQLHTALAELSARDREIVSLRYFEALSSEEVAEVLGCSTQVVYVRLHRALQRLRQHLDRVEMAGEVKAYVSPE